LGFCLVPRGCYLGTELYLIVFSIEVIIHTPSLSQSVQEEVALYVQQHILHADIDSWVQIPVLHAPV